MFKTAEEITNKEYKDLKKSLIEVFELIANPKKQTAIENIQKMHKQAASIKAFDLVSIALSYLGLLNFKNEPGKYYSSLASLNDAKYLAISSNSPLATKINTWAFAQIELLEKNPDSALDLIQSALIINTNEEYDFNSRMLEVKTKAERLTQQVAISQTSPKFTPEKHANDDPLIALLKVGRTIAVETNIDTLLTIIAQEIKLALNADRCTVFLLDEEKGELWSKVALGMNLKEIRFKADMGIAGYVATSGETVNIKNAYEDERFNKEIDQQTGYKTENILCMPIRNMGHEIVGVFQVLNKQSGEFTQKDEDLLVAIGSSAGIALENASLFDRQQRFIEEQKELLSSFIDTLSASIDARDKITSGHSKRVTLYTELICTELNMSEADKNIIRQASLLHDIGKIGIKDSVLQKEGKLTDDEYNHIQEHAHITFDILSKIYSSADFKEVAMIASSHHEKFDGTGYFQGLKGKDIPLGGRIIAVSDVFDAITSRRHYRSKMQIGNAIGILLKDSSKHFDKDVVDIFLNISVDKITEVFLTDTDVKVPDGDKAILEEYKLLDLYAITKIETPNPEQKRFVEIFSKYYEDRT